MQVSPLFRDNLGEYKSRSFLPSAIPEIHHALLFLTQSQSTQICFTYNSKKKKKK